MSLNLCVLQGRLTKDVELKDTKTGKKVGQFCIAVDRWDKDAEANFIDCVAWGSRAETISKYFKKGSPILITGRLDQQSWKSEDGTSRSRILVIVDEFQFVGGREKQESSSEQNISEISEDSIPF